MAWISGKDPSTETQDYVSETQLCPQQAKQIRTGDRTSLSSLLEIEVSVPLAQGHRDKGNKWHLLCKGLDALLLNRICWCPPSEVCLCGLSKEKTYQTHTFFSKA